jgi:hypothetical protein
MVPWVLRLETIENNWGGFGARVAEDDRDVWSRDVALCIKQMVAVASGPSILAFGLPTP